MRRSCYILDDDAATRRRRRRHGAMASPPFVSILTPSFNQARFLAENLRSIAAQTRPVDEHVVADGGSTDGSRELLAAAPPPVRWVSERDGGQADALNKALAMARGDVIGWLNSDDVYRPDAVERALDAFADDPALDMVYGHSEKIDADGRVIGRVDAYPVDLEQLLAYATIPQPSCFFRRRALDRVGGVDASFRYAMDYDLWLRLGLHGTRWRSIDAVLAGFRLHGDSKSTSETARFYPEIERTTAAALASPLLPPALAARRRELRRRFHTGIGIAAYANLDVPRARQHLVQALAIDPLGVDLRLARYALKSLLGAGIVARGRALKLKLGSAAAAR
jgi:GT2 family glycosyltransferase